jgi:two-component system sensor histidine kinase UhpB
MLSFGRMASTPRARSPRLSLVDRALISSTGLLLLIFVLLLVTPVTVSAPIRTSEVVVLAIALVTLIALNVMRVRRSLAPLRNLTEEMRNVDLAHPDRARVGGSSETRELAAFTQAFNAMLERLWAERRAGSRAALLAQERERRRIAQALHDEAGQTLTAVALQVERAATHGPESERQRMSELARELHNTLDEIRRIARELRPEALDDLGLVNALIALSSRLARQGSLQIERRLADDIPDLPEDVELVIYRVAQEALTNVLRHSEADRCLLELTNSSGRVTLSVRDNGRGLPAQLDGDTIGIEGMRERALLVGGRLQINSRPAGGTEVTLTVPLESSDARSA